MLDEIIDYVKFLQLQVKVNPSSIFLNQFFFSFVFRVIILLQEVTLLQTREYIMF